MTACPVAWCDQGIRPHRIHEVTEGTWAGESVTGPDRGMFAQVIVVGLDDEDARPVLAIVDTADDSQTDVSLSWEAAHELAAAIIAAAARFRRLNTPQ